MSVNANTKFQLHIFPIDRVTALNVHQILVQKFNVREFRNNINGRPREGNIENTLLLYVYLNDENAFKDFNAHGYSLCNT